MIILNRVEESQADITISGDIMPDDLKWFYGEDITSPRDIRNFLKENENIDVIFNINSGGGDVFSGTEIANLIRTHKGKTIANIESLAGSIASVIAFSCDKIKMPKNSYLMIHKPFANLSGDSDKLRDTANLLDKIQNNIEYVYQKKALDGVTDKQISKMVNATTWFTGEEATKYFDIELLDEVKVLNCTTNMEFENAPSFLLKKNTEKVEENESETSKLSPEIIEKVSNLKKF
ncbi:head maturation protease, ClpP-related [Streptobacillus canis]|uniref:head maturation protease, ClpP-related n=1 Tax=Streptobacillus canis TaxID=2678686 RepID=UPI0012E14712|nr:head maturation protease, ClpP-related [Streptobacillus canis]